MIDLLLPIVVFLFLFIIKNVNILPLLFLASAYYIGDNKGRYKLIFIGIGLFVALYFNVLDYTLVFLPLLIPEKYMTYILLSTIYLILNRQFEPAFLSIIIAFLSIIKQHLDLYEHKSDALSLDLQIKKEREALYRKEENERIDRENELSRLDERNRISSELHHVIGHSITTTLMRLEVLKIKTNDVLVVRELDLIKNGLKDSMEEIRGVIHKIKDSSIDLKKELELLKVEEGLNLDLDLKFKEINPELGKDILNLIKEAITNVRKHSNAKNVYISIYEEKTFYRIEIEDDGNGAENYELGMGLKAMEELVRGYGGYFSVDGKKGFKIFMTIKKGENK